MIQLERDGGQVEPAGQTPPLAGLAGLPPQLALYLALAAGVVVLVLAWRAMQSRRAL